MAGRVKADEPPQGLAAPRRRSVAPQRARGRPAAADDALRQREERYRKIFGYSNDAIFIIDPERDRILDANPRACTMLGYSRKELLSIPVSAIHPDEMPQLQAFAQAVFDKGRGWTNELSCVTKRGQLLPAEISASTIEVDGKPRMIALVRDITERKRAEDALREMAPFAELNPAPVLRFNSDGTVLSANRAANELLGTGTAIGKPLASVLPGIEGVDLASCIRDGAIFSHPTSIGDRFFHFVCRGVPELGIGHLYGSDITEHRRAEEALRELAVLEERNRLAREIHDSLAQGLTGIIWQLNVAERAVQRGEKDALQMLKHVRSLAQECLQDARRSVWDIRSGPLGGLSLAQALRRETEQVAGDGALQVSLTVSGRERVLPSGTEAAVLRICRESLANALKHAGATEVTVSLAYRDTDVRLTVQDNGAGFDPDMPRVRSKESGGFGLIGMRERARLLGGELTVKSEPGRGTVVDAVIPLK